MKNIILIVLLISGYAFGQGFTEVGKDLTFTDIVEIPNKTRIDIYKAVKLFLNDTNQKSKYFIDMDNPDIGLISFRVRTSTLPMDEFFDMYTSYKATIDIKDGKLRYSTGNIDFFQVTRMLNSDLKLTYQSFLAVTDKTSQIADLESKYQSETKSKAKSKLLSELENEKRSQKGSKEALDKTKEIIASQSKAILAYTKSSEW